MGGVPSDAACGVSDICSRHICYSDRYIHGLVDDCNGRWRYPPGATPTCRARAKGLQLQKGDVAMFAKPT